MRGRDRLKGAKTTCFRYFYGGEKTNKVVKKEKKKLVVNVETGPGQPT